MPQPLKDQSIRQRSNKASTRATLKTPNKQNILIPDLPDHPQIQNGLQWEELTLAWWQSVWSSPMASQYLESDYFTLLRLAVLQDKFWKKPSNTVAAEIRMLERDFGLSPLNRKRLEWTTNAAEESTDKRERRRSKGAIIPHDPREALK